MSSFFSSSRPSSFENGEEATEEKLAVGVAAQTQEDDELLEAYVEQIRKLLVDQFPNPVPPSSHASLYQTAIKMVATTRPYLVYVNVDEKDFPADQSKNGIDDGPLKNNDDGDDAANENQEEETVISSMESEFEKFQKNFDKELQYYNNLISGFEKDPNYLRPILSQLVNTIEDEMTNLEEISKHPKIDFKSKIKIDLQLDNRQWEEPWPDLVAQKIFSDVQLFCAPINMAVGELKCYRDNLNDAMESVYCLSDQELLACSQKCVQEALSRLKFKGDPNDHEGDNDSVKLARKLFTVKTASILKSCREENARKLSIEKNCADSAKNIALQKYDGLMTNFVQTTLLSQHNLVKIHERVVAMVTTAFVADETFSGIPKCEHIWTDVAQQLEDQLNGEGLRASLEKNAEQFVLLKKLKKTAFSNAERQVREAIEESQGPPASEIMSKCVTVFNEFEKKIAQVPKTLRRNWVDQVTVRLSGILGQRSVSGQGAGQDPEIDAKGVNIVIYFSEDCVCVGVQREVGEKFEIVLQHCPDLYPYIHVSSPLSSSWHPVGNGQGADFLYGESAKGMQSKDEDGFVNLYTFLFNSSSTSGAAESFSKKISRQGSTHTLNYEALLALYFHRVKLLIGLHLGRSDFKPIILVISPLIFMRRKVMLINGVKMAGFQLGTILQSTTAMALTLFAQGQSKGRMSKIEDSAEPAAASATTIKKMPFTALLLHRSSSQVTGAIAHISCDGVTMVKVDGCFVGRVEHLGESSLAGDVVAMLHALGKNVNAESSVLIVGERERKFWSAKIVKSYLNPRLPSTALQELDELEGILKGAATLFPANCQSPPCHKDFWGTLPPKYKEIIPFTVDGSYKAKFPYSLSESVRPVKIFEKHTPFGKCETLDCASKGSLTIYEKNGGQSILVGQFKVRAFPTTDTMLNVNGLKRPNVSLEVKLTDCGLIEIKIGFADSATVGNISIESTCETNNQDFEKAGLRKLFDLQKRCLNIGQQTSPSSAASGGAGPTSTSGQELGSSNQVNDPLPKSPRERLQTLVSRVKAKMETEVGASTNRLILEKVRQHIYASNTLVARVGSSDMELEMQLEILETAAARIKT